MTQEIIDYYEACQGDYRRYWNLDESLAMHAGFWDETVSTLSAALQRENEVLSQMVQIKEADHVLDAGCGVGGSCLYLAKTYGCKVTGITIVQRQRDEAAAHAEKLGIYPRPRFYVMDYLHTTFEAESFDVVWGLESVSHALDKHAFVQEAWRLLRPGGRLIVADGFKNEGYEKQLSSWLGGWGLQELESIDSFHGYLRNSSFTNISYTDATTLVLPSSKKLSRLARPALLLSRVGELFGKRTALQSANIRSAIYQYKTLQKGFWSYAIFLAEKA